jgi:hypothetical protein
MHQRYPLHPWMRKKRNAYALNGDQEMTGHYGAHSA